MSRSVTTTGFLVGRVVRGAVGLATGRVVVGFGGAVVGAGRSIVGEYEYVGLYVDVVSG
jgi:hypothetical protein